MLSLNNVSKTYVSKSKTQTQALKEVSLDIANRGMVFILGKSGSGKSTLLNLLGGLDNPTSGEILVDGVSMAQFTQRDYDSYRNNYVGFIFQEFNLLADFNVRDNVALALNLTKADNIDAKVSESLKQVELNDDYLTRRIDEMSGGEKQRIAIARALIKDSKIILADEPTGNLDSATGESIWNILKSLSKERLVIVVSHDRESAEKYADRIIEISDGQVVTDNGDQPQTEEHPQPITTTNNRLSFKTRLKMGFNNLRLRKGKTASTVVMTVFCTLAILITQMFLSFSPEVALADYMLRNNVDYFIVEQGYNDNEPPYGFCSHFTSLPISDSMQQYVKDNCRIISGTIQSKQDVLDYGFTFVGDALELDDNSFYAMGNLIDGVYTLNGQVQINNSNYVPINKDQHPIEFLIGKRVVLPLINSGGNVSGILAGVIDCKQFVNKSALPKYYCTENFDGFGIPRYRGFNYSESEVTIRLSDKQFQNRFALAAVTDSHLKLGTYDAIVTADGIWSSKIDVKLADNEVILTYKLYAEMFNANFQEFYYDSDTGEVLNVPPEIGQSFALKFYDNETGEVIADYGEVKLAGILFVPYSNSTDIFVTANAYKQIDKQLYRPYTMVVQTSSVKNLKSFVKTLRRKHLGYIENASILEVTKTNGGSWDGHIAFYAYGLEQDFRIISFIPITLCAILVVILVLLVINLISISVANRKKETGILSALGASNKDITSIFLIETAIIAAIGFVVTLALSFIVPPIFNAYWSAERSLTIVFPLIRVSIVTAATLSVSSFGLLLLATLLPLRKIMKLKPIDAIRNI